MLAGDSIGNVGHFVQKVRKESYYSITQFTLHSEKRSFIIPTAIGTAKGKNCDLMKVIEPNAFSASCNNTLRLSPLSNRNK